MGSFMVLDFRPDFQFTQPVVTLLPVSLLELSGCGIDQISVVEGLSNEMLQIN
jgi:hypothetical protein